MSIKSGTAKKKTLSQKLPIAPPKTRENKNLSTKFDLKNIK